MRKEFTPNALELAIHRSFDQVIIIINSKEHLYPSSLENLIEKWLLGRDVEPNIIKDEMFRLDLIYDAGQSNGCVFGKLGLSIKDTDEPYLDYLRNEHQKK